MNKVTIHEVSFYTINVNKDFSYQVKIVKNYLYGSMGSIKGRNIYLFHLKHLDIQIILIMKMIIILEH